MQERNNISIYNLDDFCVINRFLIFSTIREKIQDPEFDDDNEENQNWETEERGAFDMFQEFDAEDEASTGLDINFCWSLKFC